MSRELSVDELQDLLGAYALDALPPDEREQVERFLERSPRARDEVAQFRETAALLARAGTDAPTGLWNRIADALDEPPPALRLAPAPAVPSPAHARRRLIARLAAAAGIAAATAAIVALGIQVVHQGDQIERLEANAPRLSVLAAAEAAKRDPAAENVALVTGDGRRSGELVYLPDGSGFLIDDNLTPLGADRTYQLWAVVGGRDAPRAISAGVLGPDPGVTAFRVDGDVRAFLITDEEAPGVTSTTNPPVLRGDVTS